MEAHAPAAALRIVPLLWRRGLRRSVPPRHLPPQLEQPHGLPTGLGHPASAPNSHERPAPGFEFDRGWLNLMPHPADLYLRYSMRGLPKFANLFTGVFRGRLAYIFTIRFAQLCGFLIAGITAFLLRFEFSIPRKMLPALWIGTGVWVLTKAVVFHLFGLGHGMWRYFNTRDLLRVAKANVVASSIASVALMTACPVSFPRSVLIVDFLVSMLFSAGMRVSTRMAMEVASRG